MIEGFAIAVLLWMILGGIISNLTTHEIKPDGREVLRLDRTMRVFVIVMMMFIAPFGLVRLFRR